MALDLLFTGLLLFSLDEKGVTIRFVPAHGHVPRVTVMEAGVEKEKKINKSLLVTGMRKGPTDSVNSFDLLVPSIGAVAKNAGIGKIDPAKLKGMLEVVLTSGTLSAEGGTRWCEFKGTKSAGYGILSSIVRWRGEFEKISVDGADLSLANVTEVLIHNDMEDPRKAKPHFSEYFTLVEGNISPAARPLPCRDEYEMLGRQMSALEASIASRGSSKHAVSTALRIFYKGNPLFCPPAQQ